MKGKHPLRIIQWWGACTKRRHHITKGGLTQIPFSELFVTESSLSFRGAPDDVAWPMLPIMVAKGSVSVHTVVPPELHFQEEKVSGAEHSMV